MRLLLVALFISALVAGQNVRYHLPQFLWSQHAANLVAMSHKLQFPPRTNSTYSPHGRQRKIEDVSIKDTDKQTILDLHNAYRQRVADGRLQGQPGSRKIPLLKWSKELEMSAQRHANRCRFQHDRRHERSTSQWPWVGQNIAYSSSVDENVRLWFDEHKDYHYQSNTCHGTCGHYTQLVWAKTTHVGCGINRCNMRGSNVIFVVCNYGTGGNVNNARPY